MGITILYTRNLHNTVRQLYFRKKILLFWSFSLHRFPQRSFNLLLEKRKTGWQCSGSQVWKVSWKFECSSIYTFIYSFSVQYFPFTQHHSIVPSVTLLKRTNQLSARRYTGVREDNHLAMLTAAETEAVHLLIKSTLLFSAPLLHT